MSDAEFLSLTVPTLFTAMWVKSHRFGYWVSWQTTASAYTFFFFHFQQCCDHHLLFVYTCGLYSSVKKRLVFNIYYLEHWVIDAVPVRCGGFFFGTDFQYENKADVDNNVWITICFTLFNSFIVWPMMSQIIGRGCPFLCGVVLIDGVAFNAFRSSYCLECLFFWLESF